MNRRMLFAGMVVALASVTLAPAAADRWLHVRVVESGDEPQIVRVNVPLSLFEKVVPLIRVEEFQGGKVKIGEEELGETDLRAIWEALRDSDDAEYVRIDGADENVRVSKSGEYLVVDVEGREAGAPETVAARLPLAVIDALLSGDKDELNILAAIRALSAHEGDLVTVKEESSTVRVWIDDRNTSE